MAGQPLTAPHGNLPVKFSTLNEARVTPRIWLALPCWPLLYSPRSGFEGNHPSHPQVHRPPNLTNRIVNPLHLNPSLRQQTLPRDHREQTDRVGVHLDPQVGASLDEVHVCRLDGRVVGVEVGRILDVGELGLGVAVGLVVDAGRIEGVGVIVGRGDA